MHARKEGSARRAFCGNITAAVADHFVKRRRYERVLLVSCLVSSNREKGGHKVFADRIHPIKKNKKLSPVPPPHPKENEILVQAGPSVIALSHTVERFPPPPRLSCPGLVPLLSQFTLWNIIICTSSPIMASIATRECLTSESLSLSCSAGFLL